MRPTNTTHSYLRNPLDQILGYPANIQLLRILIETGRGMSTGEIAGRTGLSVPGVHKVISRLLETGFIEQQNSGKTQLTSLRKSHPIASDLIRLFQAEKKQLINLTDSLKSIAGELKQQPTSVWIYGDVAKGTDDYGDPLQLAVYGPPRTTDLITSNYRDSIVQQQIERKFDVTIEVRAVTAAETELVKDPNKILLWGFDPNQIPDSSDSASEKTKHHNQFDQQALTDANVWAGFLKAHPEVIERTKDSLKQKLKDEKSGTKAELQEWYRLLNSMSFQRLKKFLQSDSERSVRLRQSLPFWPVLTQAEREKFKTLAGKK